MEVAVKSLARVLQKLRPSKNEDVRSRTPIKNVSQISTEYAKKIRLNHFVRCAPRWALFASTFSAFGGPALLCFPMRTLHRSVQTYMQWWRDKTINGLHWVLWSAIARETNVNISSIPLSIVSPYQLKAWTSKKSTSFEILPCLTNKKSLCYFSAETLLYSYGLMTFRAITPRRGITRHEFAIFAWIPAEVNTKWCNKGIIVFSSDVTHRFVVFVLSQANLHAALHRFTSSLRSSLFRFLSGKRESTARLPLESRFLPLRLLRRLVYVRDKS